MELPEINQNEGLQKSFDSYDLFNIDEDPRLNELTRIASEIYEVPMVVITILNQEKQWFKSSFGMNIRETPIEISFCKYTVKSTEIFEVSNAMEDIRFKNNPLVLSSPYIQSYCGAPITNNEGIVLGSFGLIDNKPRKFRCRQKS